MTRLADREHHHQIHGPTLTQPDSDLRPGKTTLSNTQIADDATLHPLEALRVASSLVRALREIDGPRLEAATQHNEVLMPLIVGEIRHRLWLATSMLQSAVARQVATEPRSLAVRKELEPVAMRVESLLAIHDRMATASANARAIDEWLRADLASRDAAQPPFSMLGITNDPSIVLAQAPTSQPSQAPPDPEIPAGHQSHEITVEIGKDNAAVTGAAVCTYAWGKSGVGTQAGPADNEIKTLENTASVKVNGFAAKLSTAILNDEANIEVLDGFSVAVELNIAELTMDTESPRAGFELVNVAVKFVGDATKWLGANKHLTLTIDGRLIISLDKAIASRLAKRLAAFTKAQLDERILAKELEELAPKLEAEQKAHDALKDRRRILKRGPHDADELRRIEQEIAERYKSIGDMTKQTRGVAQKLHAARGRTRSALSRMKGGLSKKLAKVLAKKTAQRVMRAVLHMIPVLNAISVIVDVIELISLLRSIDWENLEFGGGGGAGDAGRKGDSSPSSNDEPATSGSTADNPGAGGADAGSGKRPTKGTQGSSGSDGRTKSGPVTNPGQVDAPPSRTGPVTDPSHVDATQPKGRGGPVTTPEQQQEGAKEARDPHDGSFGGPVTSPEQTIDLNDPMVVIEDFPVAVAARWFHVVDGQLVMTAIGRAWIAKHVGKTIKSSKVIEALPTISRKRDHWTLKMSFRFQGPSKAMQTRTHDFFVIETGGILRFEPFTMIEVRGRS